jgi:IS30 family transposase
MRSKRKSGKKIVHAPGSRQFAGRHLSGDRSPEETSKRPQRVEKRLTPVSASAIRRHVKSACGRRIEWHRSLVLKKKRRRVAARKRVEGKRMISNRPSKISKRRGLGHVEGGFIVSGKGGRGMVFALRDRKTRKNLLEKILPASLRTVDLALGRMKKRYPGTRTITSDGDILFPEHKKLEEKYGLKICFCFPRSPWQKPSIENLNKVLRRYIPKGSDVSRYPRAFIKSLEAKLNRKFMGCLGSLTPDEAYEKEKGRKRRWAARSRRKQHRSN